MGARGEGREGRGSQGGGACEPGRRGVRARGEGRVRANKQAGTGIGSSHNGGGDLLGEWFSN